MKPVFKIAVYILLTSTVVFVSCKKEKLVSTVVITPPIARAGADQVITTSVASLDGSTSSDPENNIAGYTWTKISGPSSFNIANANASQTQVTNLVQGVYQFELKVIDAGGLFSKDTVNITMNDQYPLSPIADSLTGQEFIFNGLVWAYDVDGGGNLYIGVENRPELFSNNNRSVEVSVKPDSLNTWTIAEKFHYPNSSEFVYSIYSNSLFLFHNPHIFPWSADTHLAGKVFSVKVKFL
jgi:hypothetical protein